MAITAHGGFINGFLVAVGRKPYSLPTGGEYFLPPLLDTNLDDHVIAGILPVIVQYTRS